MKFYIHKTLVNKYTTQASARCAESCLCPQQEKQETKNGNHTSLTKRAQVFLRWHEERLRQE
jgi:hypothetical protein